MRKFNFNSRHISRMDTKYFHTSYIPTKLTDKTRRTHKVVEIGRYNKISAFNTDNSRLSTRNSKLILWIVEKISMSQIINSFRSKHIHDVLIFKG